NGANTSFVHALLDERTPVEKVVVDPVAAVESAGAGPHPRIPLPANLYGPSRKNSQGLDLSIAKVRQRLAGAVAALDGERLQAGPIVPGRLSLGPSPEARRSPADL